MKETPVHPIFNDLINLVIAVIPWLLPEIPIFSKILICLVLIGIIVISRTRPNFITNYWNPIFYLFVISLSIGFGVVSWYIYLKVLNPTEITETRDFLQLAFSAGLSYGIIVGVPLSMFGAQVGQTSKLVPAFFKAIAGTLGGCLIQVLVFLIILIAIWIYINPTTQDIVVSDSQAQSMFKTPVYWRIIGPLGPIIGGLISKVLFYLVNLAFDRSSPRGIVDLGTSTDQLLFTVKKFFLAGLLNFGYSVIGYLMGLIRKILQK